MANKKHDFHLTLKMDDKIIATRGLEVVEYNDNVIYSLRLNQLMTEMMKLVEDAMRDKSINDAHRLIERGVF